MCLGEKDALLKIVAWSKKKIAVGALIKCFALYKISFALIAFSPSVNTELATKMGIYQLSVQSPSLFLNYFAAIICKLIKQSYLNVHSSTAFQENASQVFNKLMKYSSAFQELQKK